tara:strand:+ start:2897 stop:3853 length:957 start_codon:yes stop_codon:yes gene_type:complete
MQLERLIEINNEELISIMEFMFGISVSSLLLNSKYYSEYNSDFEDLSFCVFSDDFSSIVLFLIYRINDKLTLDESGARIFVRENSHQDSMKTALKHIDSIFCAEHINFIHISNYLQNGNLSKIDNMLLAQGYSSRLIFDMSVSSREYDLDLYHSSIRKSYKSLINWGRKNISISYVNEKNLDKQAFDSFRSFHRKVSNKVTRSLESWDIQYDMISRGYGELSLGYKDGDLVTGILALRHLNMIFYAVGVHERELFKYGLSHYILYDAVSRNLSNTNNPSFLLGYYDTTVKDKKTSSINFFKKGFCPNLKPLIVWYKEK